MCVRTNTQPFFEPAVSGGFSGSANQGSWQVFALQPNALQTNVTVLSELVMLSVTYLKKNTMHFFICLK